MLPGNPGGGVPDTQANSPGTTGRGQSANPENPQDRTTRPNPQNLRTPIGKNPQDFRTSEPAPKTLGKPGATSSPGIPPRPPDIMREETR
jgi:hypothetical protein